MLLVFLHPLMTPARAQQPQRLDVSFGGVMLAVPESQSSKAFPKLAPLLPEMAPLVRQQLSRADAKLPFKLHFDTDNHLGVTNSEYPVLTVLISGENTLIDTFSGRTSSFTRAACNVSLVGLVFDAMSKKVLVSVPLTSEVVLKTDRRLSESEVGDAYQKALTQGVSVLIDRMERVSPGRVQADVQPSGDIIRLDQGENAGALEGSIVRFEDSSGDEVGRGRIVSVEPTACSVLLTSGRLGVTASFLNLKAYSENSYQVIGVESSSKRVQSLFDSSLYTIAGQWFSDYLGSAGRTMLPPRVGGDWSVKGAVQVMRIYPLGSDAISLELPAPRYAVRLDVSGLGSKVISSNAIETWRLFKAWSKFTVVDSGQSIEVDASVQKLETNQLQEYGEKEVFLDAIQQSLAKLARSL